MSNSVRLIKKYPNRRLYDTKTSSYITLVDVKELVLQHEDFQVVDAKTGEDLTRSILLQIILEEEAGGAPMFSSEMLSQMIRFYGSEGTGNPEARLHQMRTDVANKISKDAAVMRPDVFCKAYASRIAKAAQMSEPKIRQWAQTVFAGHPVSHASCR